MWRVPVPTTHLTGIGLELFFFKHTAAPEIYTLSLHDALPISCPGCPAARSRCRTASCQPRPCSGAAAGPGDSRSEEHTSELQSRPQLVCRLLLEKKNKVTSPMELGTPHPVQRPPPA